MPVGGGEFGVLCALSWFFGLTAGTVDLLQVEQITTRGEGVKSRKLRAASASVFQYLNNSSENKSKTEFCFIA